MAARSARGETLLVFLIHFEDVQGSTNRRAPGLVNFVLALAYHF